MKIEKIISLIDFTTLGALETKNSINDFVDQALNLEENNLPVAGICTYSLYSDLLVRKLEGSSLKSIVVVGGFPHSQVPLSIKLEEMRLMVSKKVDEIDFVLSQDLIARKDIDGIKEELSQVRIACKEATVKVILETGHISSCDTLKEIAGLCCEAKMDFIKTSTGKIEEGATPEKFKVICEEILKSDRISGKMTGVKVSGGVRTEEDALTYMQIVKDVLGEEYLNPELFRIGASSLVSNLIKE